MSDQNPTYFQDPDVPSVKSSFFQLADAIKSSNWNQYFPYQLRVVVADVSEDGNATYTDNLGFRFTLPIPPQELNISMNIATTVEATLNGIVETHGGAPFRDIVLQGTTGITPVKNRVSGTDQDRGGRAAQSILAGSFGAIDQIKRGGQILTSSNAKPEFNSNLNEGISETDNDTSNNRIPARSTGYYQYRKLQDFIESYVELKKKNQTVQVGGKSVDTRNLRLAFCVWKDQAVYLCSGVNFSSKRSVSNPLEYMYTLQLKAWKRISSLDDGRANIENNHEFVARKPNFYASLMTRILAVNEIMDGGQKFFKSIIQDPVNRLTEVLRETNVFLKTTVGIGLNVKDLPKSIQTSVVPLIVDQWEQLSRTFNFDPNPPHKLVDGAGKIINQPFSSDDEINRIFTDIDMSKLKSPIDLQKKINGETIRVREKNRRNFEEDRDQIRDLADQFANNIGAGDNRYNDAYGLPETAIVRVPTDEEFNTLWAMNEMAIVLDHLAASSTVNPFQPDSLEYVAGLAQRSGIAFTVPTSKFAVPFPYGFSLERLAMQYLGDANRWHEIVTLNGLRAPYVDEEGFSMLLLVNGDQNIIYVADKSNLHLNQAVYLSSVSTLKMKRRIIEIREISTNYNMIVVDGEANLDQLLVAEHAKLEAFLPGTVNSQQSIFIPSSEDAPEDPKTKAVPGVDEFDKLLQISGIDLLLTQDGDLAVTPDGDIKLAYGIQNIIQTVKLALATPKGSLLQHPSYGLAIEVGTSTADVSAKDIVDTAVNMFKNDPTFTGVKSARVEKIGPSISITLVIGITGLSENVPITFMLLS